MENISEYTGVVLAAPASCVSDYSEDNWQSFLEN